MKKKLKNITLVGIDCTDINRLKLAADICQKDIEFGAVKLLSSIPDADSRVVAINPICSKEDYSYFMMRKLNDFVDTDFALIIQYDGFILNPKAWTDEFLKYDYIGAPWWYTDGINVGNGGFSLRSKKLLEITQKYEFMTQYHPEDHCICRVYGKVLENCGIKFAPEELAKKFSIEGALKSPELPVKYGSAWTDEFGFHGVSKTDLSKWRDLHPEFYVDENSIILNNNI